MKSSVRGITSVLNINELAGFQQKLPKWSLDENKHASREYKFYNFKQAWEFMRLVSKVAMKNEHHPQWTNVYNLVSVTLTTESVGGLSKKDLYLASFMDKAEKIIKSDQDDH